MEDSIRVVLGEDEKKNRIQEYTVYKEYINYVYYTICIYIIHSLCII